MCVTLAGMLEPCEITNLHELRKPGGSSAEAILASEAVCVGSDVQVRGLWPTMCNLQHWCENADALWEEFCMTREACR